MSNDGITWTKVPGKEPHGAILAPTVDDPTAWDACQIGVGDVVRNPGAKSNPADEEDELIMFYFGGSNEEVAMGPPPNGDPKVVGFRMRIGRAVSTDRGRSWTKDATYCLDYDESEGFFCSWPRIVLPNIADDDNEPWRMFYHSFNGVKFRAFGAKSHDAGRTWQRTGLVLSGATEEGAFDSGGIGTRHVIPWRQGLLMIYEGVDGGKSSSTHRFGAAYCRASDVDDREEWVRLNSGKPILEPGKPPLGEWCKHVIGTPFIVPMPDGGLRLYHCGRESATGRMAIGMVVSPSGDVEPGNWVAT